MVDRNGRVTQWRFKPPAGVDFTTRVPLAGQAGSAEEEAFLWTMADLMTLLLIFFVLLYANAVHAPASAARESQPQMSTTAPPSDLYPGPAPQSAASEPTPTATAPEPNSEPPEASRPSAAAADPIEPRQRAHAPLLAAGLASERGIDLHPYGEDSPRLAAGRVQSLNQAMVNTLQESFSNDFYVRWDEKQPVFVLGERITFNAGEAMLLNDSQPALRRIAEMIAPLDDCRIIVSGHTDNVAIHTPAFPSNWELSAARAANVAKFLASCGVAPQRLIIQGKSEFHPLVANTSAQNRRANRRVEISVNRGFDFATHGFKKTLTAP
ncbi:OmpA family protein [Desulfosarcina sp.]|uniref:OmpA family protein n=1 Tax=Desulfosarcina sp. TaxID=2027861 RepID=UPI003970A4AB